MTSRETDISSHLGSLKEGDKEINNFPLSGFVLGEMVRIFEDKRGKQSSRGVCYLAPPCIATMHRSRASE